MRKEFNLFWIFLFLIGVTLPVIYINKSDVSNQENRTLAKFPDFQKKGKLNDNYGKEFETWIGDHFWKREKLINARFQALYKINGRVENERAFVGDDGWMFEKRRTVNRPSVKKQRKKIEKNANILKRFADKFKGKNIPIYLVIIPEREVLYQKYWEKYYKPKPKLDYGDNMIKLLKDIPSIHIIYPKNEFLSEKEETFLKRDGHLNFTGGNLIKNAFLKELKKLFQLNIVNEAWIHAPRKSRRKYIANTLGITDDYEELDFSIDIKTDDSQKDIVINSEENPVWPMIKKAGRKGSGIKKDIFVIGDCYGLGILWPISAKLFENANFYRVNYKEDWLTIKQYFLQDMASPNEKIIVLVGYDMMYGFLEYF